MADLVSNNRPPLWLVDYVISPLMRILLPTPVGRLLPGIAVLRFRGRRSGDRYSVPTGIFDYEGVQVVFTDGTWLANFRQRMPLELVRRGGVQSTWGQVVDDPEYVGSAIRAVLDRGTSATLIGLKIERGHRPSDQELASLRAVVVIDRPGQLGGRQ